MSRYRFYHHKAMRTIAAEILTSFYVKEKRLWKVKVCWWTWSEAKGIKRRSGFEQRFTVSVDDLPDWEWIKKTSE